MKQNLLTVLLISAGSLLATAAKASPMDTFTITNTNNSTNISFVLPASGVPSGINSACQDSGTGTFCYNSVPVDLNGVVSADTVQFFNSYSSGGLEIFLPDETAFNLYGAQLFTGSLSSPTFRTGTFSQSESVDGINDFSVTISPESTSPVPEPSSLAFLGTGILAAAGVVRRKLRA